jgi:hypothetical protein
MHFRGNVGILDSTHGQLFGGSMMVISPQFTVLGWPLSFSLLLVYPSAHHLPRKYGTPNMSKKLGWLKSDIFTTFWGIEHSFASQFLVHQGARVLTDSLLQAS